VSTSTPRSEREELPLWDGRFKLLYPLWQGEQTDLGVAEDPLRGVKVVIKRLRRESSVDIAPFLREYRIHRQLSHPAIPRALELGFTRDGDRLCPYLVLEHVEGVSLSRWVTSGEPCPDEFVLDLAIEILRALDHVHRQGFIHGDVSPMHVIVLRRGGRATFRLVDFGTALPRNRVIGDELWRRPHFPAPELLAGGSVDPRADLYALGMLLSWLESTSSPKTPRASRVSELISRMTAPAPSDRPMSASAAMASLSAVESVEIEPEEAFVARLLGMHLPRRALVESLARELCLSHTHDPRATFIELPRGLPVNRLLGAAMDEAAARRARVVPVLASPDATRGLTSLVEGFDLESREPGEPERLLFIAVEDFERTSSEVVDSLLRLCGSHGRLLAVCRGREAFAAARSAHPAFAAARSVVIEPWSAVECSAWLHRAFGRIGAPWEREELPNPPSPLALVEWLADLYRDGRLVRAQDGYAWRDGPGDNRIPDSLPEPAPLLTRLAYIARDIPYRALTLFAGVWATELEEMLATQRLREDGQGRVDVRALGEVLVDERRGQADGSRELDRLVRCLGARGSSPWDVAEVLMINEDFRRALPHLELALELGELPPGGWFHAFERWLDTEPLAEERLAGNVVAVRIGLARGELELAARHLARVESLSLDDEARERVELLQYELELEREDHRAALRAMQRLGRRARSFVAARMHFARALGLWADGLPGAAAAEADAGLEAVSRGSTGSLARNARVDPERVFERRLALLSAEITTDALWSDMSRGKASPLQSGEKGPSVREVVLETLVVARRHRFLGRIDLAVEALGSVESLRDRLESRDAHRLDLEMGWAAFECGDFDDALAFGTECISRGQLRLRAEAQLLRAQVMARVGTSMAALTELQPTSALTLPPMDPLALDLRLTRLELELAARGKDVAPRLIPKALGLGHGLARRLHGRRAARAFRLASEAAMLLPEIGFASEYARLASHALGTVAEGYILRASFHASSARALTHDLRLAEAEERHALSRATLQSAALAIASLELRAAWLAHPDQTALVAGAPGSPPSLRF
jgi:serine/threonine protein kinase